MRAAARAQPQAQEEEGGSGDDSESAARREARRARLRVSLVLEQYRIPPEHYAQTATFSLNAKDDLRDERAAAAAAAHTEPAVASFVAMSAMLLALAYLMWTADSPALMVAMTAAVGAISYTSVWAYVDYRAYVEPNTPS
jgi:hypothetical protein